MHEDKTTPAPVTIIEPSEKLGLDWAEFIKNKELLFFFTWRNFKIRYKQTLIGAGWAVFRPLILMIVFTVLFNKVAKIDSGTAGLPYPVFSYAGLLFWTYFAQTTTQVGQSLVTYQGILKKIYFPRFIIPVSTAMTGIIDFFFSAIIYVGLLAYYQIVPGLLGLVLFIPMLLLAILTVIGVGTFMAAMNVQYRDVKQALPFMIQILMYLTPVIYPVTLLAENLRWILFLNPMTGVIETMRSSLLSTSSVNWGYLGISTLSCFTILFFGLWYFRVQERKVADHI